MRNVDNSLRVEYWKSKASVMQGRIGELEKNLSTLAQTVQDLGNDVLKMREWAKTVVVKQKELENGINRLNRKEGHGGGHSNAEAVSGQGVAG